MRLVTFRDCVKLLQINKRIAPLVEYISDVDNSMPGNYGARQFAGADIQPPPDRFANRSRRGRNRVGSDISLAQQQALGCLAGPWHWHRRSRFLYVHPGMFGSVATEAIVTGIAAAVLSYLVGTTVQFARARFVTAD
jgi:hypothetical protein